MDNVLVLLQVPAFVILVVSMLAVRLDVLSVAPSKFVCAQVLTMRTSVRLS